MDEDRDGPSRPLRYSSAPLLEQSSLLKLRLCARVRRSRIPQPTFALPEPLRLATRGDRPMHQGPLLLVAGPHRVEGGWVLTIVEN